MTMAWVYTDMIGYTLKGYSYGKNVLLSSLAYPVREFTADILYIFS